MTPQPTPEHVQLNPFSARWQLLLLTLAFEGGLLVLALVLAYFANVPFWRDMGGPDALFLGVLLTAPVIAVVVLLADKTAKVFGQLRRDFENVVQLFTHSTLVDLLIVSLLAGICEEALFRGFLQNWLSGWGEGFAVSITALAFGLAHAVSLQYFLFAVLISVYLSLTYIYSEALLAPMALHATYDFVMLVYGTRYWMARRRSID